MGYLSGADYVLRVERGRAEEDELAALTVVLLALRAEAERPRDPHGAGRARWWLGQERYKSPSSWRVSGV